MIEMKLEGLSELKAQLKELKGKVGAQKTIRRAARKAIEPVVEKAKAAAPYDSDANHVGAHLRDSIRITVPRGDGSDGPLVKVGIKVANIKAQVASVEKKLGKRTYTKLSKTTMNRLARRSAAWRFHFTELGTSKSPAKPFIRPAFESSAEEMIATISAELQKEVDKLLRKKARKAKGKR